MYVEYFPSRCASAFRITGISSVIYRDDLDLRVGRQNLRLSECGSDSWVLVRFLRCKGSLKVGGLLTAVESAILVLLVPLYWPLIGIS